MPRIGKGVFLVAQGIESQTNFVDGPWNSPCNGWKGPVERQEPIGPAQMPPGRYRASSGALSGGFATPELHHHPERDRASRERLVKASPWSTMTLKIMAARRQAGDAA